LRILFPANPARDSRQDSCSNILAILLSFSDEWLRILYLNCEEKENEEEGEKEKKKEGFYGFPDDAP